MDEATILITLCSVAAVTLLIVHIVNLRQKARKRLNHQLKLLKFRFDSLEALAFQISSLVDSSNVSTQVYSEAQQILQKMSSLAPEESWVKSLVQSSTSQFNALSNTESQPVFRYFETEKGIGTAKHALAEAARVVKQRMNRQQIPKTSGDELIAELNWSTLLVDVVSWVGKGLKERAAGRSRDAYRCYKQAETVLTGSSLQDKRREQCLNEVSELMENERDLLSPQFMPEANLLVSEMSKTA